VTTTTTPKALLQRAADIITERGWHQGNYTDPKGCGVCALGAIHIAYAEAKSRPHPFLYVSGLSKWAEDPPLKAAYDGLRDQIGDWISDWNDEEGRTAEEVMAAFRAAAEAAE